MLHGPSRTASAAPSARQQVLTRHVITVMLVLIAAFTFAFSFTNVWALGVRLGVSTWAAPLLAPAVDLSVVCLLLAMHYLNHHGALSNRLIPARLLLGFCGLATLALNAAESLLRHEYGRAAFDAVGPL